MAGEKAAMATFDAWVAQVVRPVRGKGPVGGTEEAERGPVDDRLTRAGRQRQDCTGSAPRRPSARSC